MWLGVSIKEKDDGKEKFCFAALLNLTGDRYQNVCGRGVIVKDYLSSKQNFSDYARKLEENKFSGYNFVAAELR